MPATRYVIAAGSTQLVATGDPVEIAFLPGDHPLVLTAGEADFTLLGWFRGERTVLVELREAGADVRLPASTELRELRPLTPVLSPSPPRCWRMHVPCRYGRRAIASVAYVARPTCRRAPVT